jgi:hypothetical protein
MVVERKANETLPLSYNYADHAVIQQNNKEAGQNGGHADTPVGHQPLALRQFEVPSNLANSHRNNRQPGECIDVNKNKLAENDRPANPDAKAQTSATLVRRRSKYSIPSSAIMAVRKVSAST